MISRRRRFRIASAARLAIWVVTFLAAASAYSAPITITSGPTLATATVGLPYSFQLTATGGDSTNYIWSSPNLPAWLSLSTSGLLTGTPVQAPLGTQYTFTIDVSTPDEMYQQETTVTVPLGAAAPAAIQISPVTAPPAEVNQRYSYQFSATGPSGISWSLQGAPSWLTISSAGLLSGTPPSAGQIGITVVATAGESSASVAVGITIYPALVVQSATLPPGVVNAPYTQQLVFSGGASPAYTASATGLPSGLSLSNGGSLSGTPTSAGAFNFSVSIRDTAGYSASGSFSVTIAPALSITSGSLPPASIGVAYSQSLSASGGTGGYVWSASGLPQGLSVSTGGQISGTPGAAGSFPVGVTVKDSAGDTATATLTLQVNPALRITTTSLPDGVVGSTYLANLSASGSVGNVVWSLTGGTLPGGLSLSANGSITGTPSASGDSTFNVQAVDSTNLPVSASFTIHVALPPPSTLTTSLPSVLTPGSQPAVTIGVSPAYPLPLAITATLSISPDLGGPTDLGFTNGSRTIQFTIPANTTVYQLPFSTGTSAGTITVTLNVDTTGQSIIVSGSLVLNGQVSPEAPSIGAVTATASAAASTLTVVVTGFSSTRDMKTAAFHFTPAAGATLAATDFSLDVSSLFTAWYANPSSFITGSQFKLTVPFTIAGDPSTIASVTVTLTNSTAASNPVTATVQ